MLDLRQINVFSLECRVQGLACKVSKSSFRLHGMLATQTLLLVGSA